MVLIQIHKEVLRHFFKTPYQKKMSNLPIYEDRGNLELKQISNEYFICKNKERRKISGRKDKSP